MKAVLIPGDKKVDVVDRQSRDTSTRDTTFESRYGTTGIGDVRVSPWCRFLLMLPLTGVLKVRNIPFLGSVHETENKAH